MFLCDPMWPDVGAGWIAVFLVLLFFIFIWNPIFFAIAKALYKDESFEEVIKKIYNEWKWGIVAFVGSCAISAPTLGFMLPFLFFIPLFVFFFFPIYFTFTFLGILLKKYKINEKQRFFWILYYGGISFLIIYLGIFFKLRFYNNISDLIYYYTQDIGYSWFMHIFFILIFLWIVFSIFWKYSKKEN